MTHVTHLSYNTSSGGAARSASRIHRTMLASGIDSALLAVENELDGENELAVENVFATAPSLNPLRRIMRHGLRTFYSWSDRIEMKPDGPNAVFTSDRSFRGRELVRDLRNPEVIHMHWVGEMFDEASFLPSATHIAPVIWTMRDMRPITGGCHYDLRCGKFRVGCGDCPQLADPSAGDLSHRIWKRRKATLDRIDRSRLTFVAPSDWLAGEFKESPLCNRFDVRVIPNGVDTEVFCPSTENDRGSTAGIDSGAFVILFNASSLDNQIKGGSLLLEALKLIAGENTDKNPPQRKLQLLVVGSGDVDHFDGIESVSLGRLNTNAELAAAYRAADLFVIPSLQDNCPNTVLESFACGVPAVGFDAAGIPDLIKPGETGLLATAFDPSDLARQVLRIINDDELRQRMSTQCRERAIEIYSRDIEAGRYLDLYQQILLGQR